MVCQVRQQTDTVRTVIRPTWTPTSDVQRRALDDAAQRAKAAARAEQALWEAILELRRLDVPDTVICDRTGVSRATLNRKYGPRSQPAAE